MGLKDASVVQVPSRIIVADDHPLFRSAIRHTLEAHPDLEVVAEAANGHEAVELCRRFPPELVLMDLRMPQMDGIAATYAIKREFPDTPVLILPPSTNLRASPTPSKRVPQDTYSKMPPPLG